MSPRQRITRFVLGAALAAAFALTLASGGAAQVTQNTYSLGAAPHIVVDNVSGYIHLIGDGGNQVRYQSTESNPDNVAGVRLDASTSGNQLKLYVDGPFRCHDGEGDCSGWHSDRRIPRFDFELHVPAGASVDLRTVDHGDVEVSGITGAFAVRDVNGRIDLERIGGSGSATTVNGPVKAAFLANPRAASTFRSVNGPISLYFQPGLHADVSYRTLNGSVYSDFAVQSAAVSVKQSSHGNMRVFRTGRSSTVRIGGGGVDIATRTINGNIFLHQSGR